MPIPDRSKPGEPSLVVYVAAPRDGYAFTALPDERALSEGVTFVASGETKNAESLRSERTFGRGRAYALAEGARVTLRDGMIGQTPSTRAVEDTVLSLAHAFGERLAVVTPEGVTLGDAVLRAARREGALLLAMEGAQVPCDMTASRVHLARLLRRYASWEGLARDPGAVSGIAETLGAERYDEEYLRKRAERRAFARGASTMGKYAAMISEETEARALRALLDAENGVFFPGGDGMARLKEKAVREIVALSEPDELLRVWCAGCSTGEDAYSLAILFRECMDEMGRPRNVKVFATDMHARSIEKAGAGRFAEEDVSRVSEERLRRFFEKDGREYVVGSEIRAMVLFATHDMCQDPPFGHLNMVYCRDRLDSLRAYTRDHVTDMFKNAVVHGGFLALGTEALPEGGALFTRCGGGIYRRAVRRDACGEKCAAAGATVPATASGDAAVDAPAMREMRRVNAELFAQCARVTNALNAMEEALAGAGMGVVRLRGDGALECATRWAESLPQSAREEVKRLIAREPGATLFGGDALALCRAQGAQYALVADMKNGMLARCGRGMLVHMLEKFPLALCLFDERGRAEYVNEAQKRSGATPDSLWPTRAAERERLWARLRRGEAVRAEGEARALYAPLFEGDAFSGCLRMCYYADSGELSLPGVQNAGIFARRALEKGRVLAVVLARMNAPCDAETVASRLDALLRPGDLLTRTDDGLFLMLLGDLSGMRAAQLFALRLTRAFPPPLTLSAGIAVAPFDGEDYDTLRREADIALYSARNAGDGTCRFYALKYADEISNLYDAPSPDAVRVRYTPVFRADDGRPALFVARMDMPGVPEDVLPLLFERDNDMARVERFIENACRHAVAWRAQSRGADVRVLAEIAPCALRAEDFDAMLPRALRNADCPADALVAGLTEDVVDEWSEEDRARLSRLRRNGVALAMTRFDGGRMLARDFLCLPPDIAFVDAAIWNDADAAATLCRVADALGVETVACGVDTAEQAELARARGAKYLMGKYLSRDVSPEDAARFCARGDPRVKKAGLLF